MSAPAPRQPQAASAPARPSAAVADAAALDSHPLAPLHEAFGNLAVLQRLAEPAVQARLEIGAPDDEHEREADAIAASVMRRPEETAGATPAEPAVRRRAEDDDKKKGAAPQRAAGAAAKAPEKPKPPPPKAVAPPKPADKPKPPAPKPADKPKPPVAAVPKPPEGAAPGAKAPGTSEPERKRDEPVVAAKAAPGAVPAVTPAAAQTIQSQSGAGRPLAGPDRTFFEQRLGHDLGGVRIHDDAAARAAAHDIQAQAFTYGQDVYFAASRYQPGTAGGRELLAHELAHTVQQRPGARVERRVQRQPNTTPAPTTTTPAPTGGTPASQSLQLGPVAVPGWRLAPPEGHRYVSPARPLTRSPRYTNSRTGAEAQRDLWRQHMSANQTLIGRMRSMTEAWQRRNFNPHGSSGVPTGQFVLKSSASSEGRYIIGDLAYVTGEVSLPDWDRDGHTSIGRTQGFQVDHILELQLTGFPDDQSGHVVENFQLLRASVNAASGPKIDAGVDAAVIAYLTAQPPEARADSARHFMAVPAPNPGPPSSADATAVKGFYTLLFSGSSAAQGTPSQLAPADVWSRDEIERGAQLDVMKDGAPVIRVTSLAELGGNGNVAVLPSASGGYVKRLTVDPTPTSAERTSFKPYRMIRKSFNVGPDWRSQPQLGSLILEIPPDHKTFNPASATIDLERFPEAQYAGHLGGREGRGSGGAIGQQLTNLGLKKASPVVVDAADFGAEGFVLDGHVVTDIPLISGASLDFGLHGDDLQLSKTFDVAEFRVPAPLHIDSSSLTLGIRSTGELFVEGQMNASIDRLGRGYLRGAASTEHGFSLTGGFDATSDLFDPAHIELTYQDGQISGRGQIGIGSGKVPGVTRGLLDVSYAEGHFNATGHVDFSVPGVRSGEVRLDYDAEHGLVITGTVAVGDVPGIREGSLSVTVAQRPGGAGYKLSGHGTATPAIPGVDAQLTLDYDDGAFLAHAQFGLRRGMLDATVDVGATNRPLDANGQPLPGGEPLPTVTLFGSGTANMQITPWLRGTATVRLLPNGEFAVSGTLSVPGVNLWEPITPAPTNLFESPPITIPLFGPVVLELGGGLNLEYGVGAGVLSGSLGIEYNPSHEDQTHLHGNIHLHASAFAGVELHVHATVGLSAIIGSVTGGVELGAELRAEASADPDIAIDWRPDTGFVLNATIAAALTPKLVFHIDALIIARAGPFHKDFRKNLARREFGSGLQMGVSLPIHYEQGKAFAVDWSQIHVDRPEIDPVDTARRFIQEVTR